MQGGCGDRDVLGMEEGVVMTSSLVIRGCCPCRMVFHQMRGTEGSLRGQVDETGSVPDDYCSAVLLEVKTLREMVMLLRYGLSWSSAVAGMVSVAQRFRWLDTEVIANCCYSATHCCFSIYHGDRQVMEMLEHNDAQRPDRLYYYWSSTAAFEEEAVQAELALPTANRYDGNCCSAQRRAS